MDRSEVVTIEAPPPPFRSTQVDGSTITAEFVNPQAKLDDWIGLFKPSTSDREYLDWQWLDNTKTKPSQPVTNGQITFENLEPGEYEVRYEKSNWGGVVDRSEVVVVRQTAVIWNQVTDWINELFDF